MTGNGQHIGYRRISTILDTTEQQLRELELDRAFEDRASGRDTDRPQLAACLDYCRQGDTLHVHSPGTMARSIEDLRKIASRLTDKGVALHFHDSGMSLGGEDSQMARCKLDILNAMAGFERELVAERQAEGIALARARGKHLGRPNKLTGGQIRMIRAKAENGHSKQGLAKEFGVSRQTIYTVLSKADKKKLD